MNLLNRICCFFFLIVYANIKKTIILITAKEIKG